MPLLVYSEVLHVFQSAMLSYFMLFEKTTPRGKAGWMAVLKGCCIRGHGERNWLFARGGLLRWRLTLVLFIIDGAT